MANNNAPFGLSPINDNGTAWSGQGRLVYFPTSQAGNIFRGDPVVPLGGSDAFGVPAVGIATAGATNTILGAFIAPQNGPAGSGYTLLQSNPIYRQASLANYGFITDDPNQLFTVQEDSVGNYITAANAGFINGNLQAGSGGSTTTGFSSWQLVSSTVATTNTFQLRILELTRGPDNAIGNYARWTVRLNLPALWAITGY